jgi:hypothetical protein
MLKHTEHSIFKKMFSRHKSIGTHACFVFIIVLTIFWMFSVARVPELSGDASAYVGLAQSIKSEGNYRFNFENHTIYPPGFPVILALLSTLYGRDPTASYSFLMTCITFFGGLQFLVSYWLIRHDLSWRQAMIYVGLVAASPFVFQACTRSIQSDICYSLISLFALLAFERTIAASNSKRSTWLWTVMFATSFVISLTIRVIGAALLIGLFLWCLLSALRMRQRIPKTLLVSLIMGVLTEAAWIYWTRTNAVQFVPGDTSYDDFWRKNPHDPDEGRVQAWELAIRPALRLPEEMSHVSEFCFLNKWIDPVWYSPLVVLPVLLIFTAVLESLTAASPNLKVLYFLSYLGILLLWPYDVGPRYILPVLPLCFIYLCQGWKRWVSWLSLSTGAALKVLAWLSGGILCAALIVIAVGWRPIGVQAKLALLFWSLLLLLMIWLIRTAAFTRFARFRTGRMAIRWLAYMYVVGVCAFGMIVQTKMAKANAQVVETEYELYPTAEAARWIRDHISPGAVVMSSHQWLVHEITNHRVIMFPATRNPEVIMQIARETHALFLVVVEDDPWFLPTERARLDALLRAYPAALESAHAGARYRIFRFMPQGRS